MKTETLEIQTEAVVKAHENAGNRNNFQIRVAVNSHPYFVLKAQNGEIIGTSETYSSSQQLENGIKSVRLHAAMSNI